MICPIGAAGSRGVGPPTALPAGRGSSPVGSSALLVMTVWAAACTLVRPVKVTPPPAPRAFISDPAVALSRAPGTLETPSGKPGSTERATQSAVWWSAFADPALDSAIQETLRNNYFLRDVRTLIYENKLDSTTPQGWWWPLQIGIPATTPSNLQHVVIGSPSALGSPAYQLKYNAANIDLTASYQLDLWGNIDARRRVADDLVEQQRESTEIAAQNLAEQVAQLWFDILWSAP